MVWSDEGDVQLSGGMERGDGKMNKKRTAAGKM